MIPTVCPRLHLRGWPVFLFCFFFWLSSAAVAGGGPENVLLVVNRQSSNSLTIANHYVRLRQIPSANVVTLTWDPKLQATDVDTFRKQILLPVLNTIRQRRLAAQIDYIVYSSDFPTAIDLEKDADRFLNAMQNAGQSDGKKADAKQSEADKPNDRKPGGDKPEVKKPIGEPSDENKPKGKPTWPAHLTKEGSINGLTYLWQPVVAGNPAAYMQLQSNLYVRQDIPEQKDAPALGFRSSYRFGPHGERVSSGGRSYLLSVMLGVTKDFLEPAETRARRGNSLEEVLRYLYRSAAADGTHPRGTIYFAENSDVRSKVRQHMFPSAVRKLKELGVAAEIVEGVMPVGKTDVQGVMLGTASFNWKLSRSTILPGAICDHFTSFGGALHAGSSQTPLVEFLRYGAAGASGTVAEPYALLDKFPLPSLQVHYARGCTLAEAFYQSVFAPYQLLIVGDPLCRPWANIPQVSVAGVQPGATVRGTLALKPTATFRGKSKVDHFEFFVDELRVAGCDADGTLPLDTTRLADGYHQLRVVAVEAGPIQSQGRQIVPIVAANHGRTIKASAAPKAAVRRGKPLVITASASDAVAIAVLYHDHLLGKIVGKEGTLSIDPATLGFGPVSLRVVGLGTGDPGSYVWAEPIELTVENGP